MPFRLLDRLTSPSRPSASPTCRCLVPQRASQFPPPRAPSRAPILAGPERPARPYQLVLTLLSSPPPQVSEVEELAGCDFLTISPALLKELQGKNDELKQRLSVDNLGPAQEKVTFVDNEPAFRWSLLQDQMAFDKLHEGALPLPLGRSLTRARMRNVDPARVTG